MQRCRKARRRLSEYLTPAEAGVRWGVSDETVRAMCRAGEVPGAWDAGGASQHCWRIPKDALVRNERAT